MVGACSMSTSNSTFRRGLSPAFLDALEKLAEDDQKGRWWQDVLARPDLILAVRGNYLNVYYQGGSLYKIEYKNGRVTPLTHFKYLVRNVQKYISISEQLQFNIGNFNPIHQRYEGTKTLKEMMTAVQTYTGQEKELLHSLIIASPNVIDVEVSIEQAPNEPTVSEQEIGSNDGGEAMAAEEPDAKSKYKQDRLDVVSLEEGENGLCVLAFHEAKMLSNPDLKSKDEPKIVGQMKRYRRTIAHHETEILKSYEHVCHDLLRLYVLRAARCSAAKPLDPLIKRVAKKEVSLRIDPKPRLLIFGYDADQRDGSLKKISDSLKEKGLAAYAVGNPKGAKATPAFKKKTVE